MGRSSSPTEYLFTRTNSGVKKVPNRTKRLGKASKVVGRGRRFSILLRQACKDAATELSFHVEGEIGGEAVNLIRSNALKSLHTHKDIGQKPAMHIGKCSEYEINTLMAQIYQDLDRAQDSRFAADLVEMAIVKPDDWGERDGRLVSDALEVSNVIKSAVAYLQKSDADSAGDVWKSDTKTFTDSPSKKNIQQSAASLDNNLSQRYGLLTTVHDWILLSILAHSTVFREAACTVNAQSWKRITESISENAVSLQVLAKTRGIDWCTALSRDLPLSLQTKSLSIQIKTTPIKPTPQHTYIVPNDRKTPRRPRFEGTVQTSIPHSIYNRHAFETTAPPEQWQMDRPYPEDPTLRQSFGSTCLACSSTSPCSCDPLTSTIVTRPLVELKDYGTKGVGVRALSRIKAGDILDEYVGVLQPVEYMDDPIYGLAFSPPWARSGEAMALISAKRYGNWTRFINHSCDSSTVFRLRTIGGRERVMVEAVRDIDVFEEVSVDYGAKYWGNGRFCECGLEGCAFSREKSEAI